MAFTKAQLLQDLSGQSFCKQVLGAPYPSNDLTPGQRGLGVNKYIQTILEVGTAGNVSQLRDVRFLVLNEGSTDASNPEQAWYDVSSVPVAQVDVTTENMQLNATNSVAAQQALSSGATGTAGSTGTSTTGTTGS
jgi:hypothetical protein